MGGGVETATGSMSPWALPAVGQLGEVRQQAVEGERGWGRGARLAPMAFLFPTALSHCSHRGQLLPPRKCAKGYLLRPGGREG